MNEEKSVCKKSFNQKIITNEQRRSKNFFCSAIQQQQKLPPRKRTDRKTFTNAAAHRVTKKFVAQTYRTTNTNEITKHNNKTQCD